jgi:hypothetical protein
MSTYYSIEASLTYKDQSSLDEAIGTLSNGGWLVNGFIVDECSQPISSEKAVDDLQLTIPFALHRNLGRHISALSVGVDYGDIKVLTTDGQEYAGYAEFLSGQATWGHLEGREAFLAFSKLDVNSPEAKGYIDYEDDDSDFAYDVESIVFDNIQDII